MSWREVPVLDLRLPYPISANRYWRTRVARIKGVQQVMTYVSSEAKTYKDQVQWLIAAAGLRAPLEGRVAVHLTLHPHCPKDWQRRRRQDPLGWDATVQRLDLDNCRKVVNDALRAVAIVDDYWIWRDSGEVAEPDPAIEASVQLQVTRLVHERAAVPEPRQEALAL